MALLGGYDNELVEPPQELQWECSICLQILREPHMLSCCGWSYCRSCVERVQQPGESCPQCRQRFEVVPDKRLECKLMEMRVYCVNKNAGCQWVGELKNAEKHAEVDCEWTKLPCPNRCCGQHFFRHELKQHAAEECPRHPRFCEFAARGCDVGALTPDSLQDHMRGNVQEHLTLVCQKLEEIRQARKRKEMEQAHLAVVKELQGEIEEHETTIQQLRGEFMVRETRKQMLEAVVQKSKARASKLGVRVWICNLLMLLLLVVLVLILIAERKYIYEQFIFVKDWCYEACRTVFRYVETFYYFLLEILPLVPLCMCCGVCGYIVEQCDKKKKRS